MARHRGFDDLPAELIQEIFKFFAHERESSTALRLVSKRFCAIITPILFRRLKLSFEPPIGVSGCPKHGWFERAGDPTGWFRPASCYDCFGISRPETARGGLPLEIPIRGSTIYLDEEWSVPFLDPGDTKNLLSACLAFKSVKELSLGWPTGRSAFLFDDSTTEFARNTLPQLLEAMPTLRIIRLRMRPRSIDLPRLPPFLDAFCNTCSRRPEVQIHFSLVPFSMVNISDFKCCLRALFGITSVASAFGIGHRPEEVEEEIFSLIQRCPRIVMPGDMNQALYESNHHVYLQLGLKGVEKATAARWYWAWAPEIAEQVLGPF